MSAKPHSAVVSAAGARMPDSPEPSNSNEPSTEPSRKKTRKVPENDVLELLRGYRAFHTAYGGAAPIDETGMADATYGPGGIIVAGQEYTRTERAQLARSYSFLGRALSRLKRKDFQGWLALLIVYLGDPADPGRVREWREKAERLVTARLWANRHDRAVKLLRAYMGADLAEHNELSMPLYVKHPKLLSPSEEHEIESQYAEMYAIFQRLRNTGMSWDAAAEQTATFLTERGEQPVPVDVVHRVIEFRSKNKAVECDEEGCEDLAERGRKCFKHYQQRRRERLRRSDNASDA